MLSPEWQLLQKTLSEKLLEEFEDDVTPSYSYIGGEFNGGKVVRRVSN
ncbi:hypothetical protein BD31_I1568 [Candidatus Nitrosopumilus salaria BD31]|uniref:Uncharacterized protein n=1 Tax=Candidatus Nitrosopumilus salarius BD31 TaxID=859350 RepID=I3D1K9_9ARCH|nr:hypothetical protein [Candidatus Nitrosopumilus salaria]EIJ65602.1 hypothetical protein BD31_I1568 [Candidatus Nitrosopumilus salaria BD31]